MNEISEYSRARLAAIARYLPAFHDPATSVGEWMQPDAAPVCIATACFVLNETTEQFVADCYEHGWVLKKFDWAEWAQTGRAQGLRDDPAVIALATEHELAQLLTVVIRQDRFVEGSLAAAFATGLILAILQRAKQLGSNRSSCARPARARRPSSCR